VPIEFALSRKLTRFGLISDPRIPVTVLTVPRPQTFRFLLDTGADFSLAPRRLAEEAGLSWSSLDEVQVVGVERRGVTARLGQLPLRIGTTELSVRCVYVQGPGAPFILGRADFLDRFVLTIDTRRERILLDEIGGAPSSD